MSHSHNDQFQSVFFLSLMSILFQDTLWLCVPIIERNSVLALGTRLKGVVVYLLLVKWGDEYKDQISIYIQGYWRIPRLRLLEMI